MILRTPIIFRVMLGLVLTIALSFVIVRAFLEQQAPPKLRKFLQKLWRERPHR
jgi:uncharacterized membrane protein YdjX (TVP38/TMEM64 family)